MNRLPDGPHVFPKTLPNDDLWQASVAEDHPDINFSDITADQLLQQAVESGVFPLPAQSQLTLHWNRGKL